MPPSVTVSIAVATEILVLSYNTHYAALHTFLLLFSGSFSKGFLHLVLVADIELITMLPVRGCLSALYRKDAFVFCKCRTPIYMLFLLHFQN